MSVGIYKRAQILIGDIWGACEGQGLGEFNDIDTITMFADYRLVAKNKIRKTKFLKNKISKKNIFLLKNKNLFIVLKKILCLL